MHKAGFGEHYSDDAAAVLVLTGVYERLRWKYGERSYRFVCLDAGFVGQNIYLVAEALGLGTCAVSGFAQDVVETMLGVDGRSEIALALLTVGTRSA